MRASTTIIINNNNYSANYRVIDFIIRREWYKNRGAISCGPFTGLKINTDNYLPIMPTICSKNSMVERKKKIFDTHT